MDVRIYPSETRGSVDIPVSKSVMHRALICASFSPHPVRIFYSGDLPEDVLATIGALRCVGCSVTVGSGYADICSAEVPTRGVTDCLRSASTLRFMLPLAAAKGAGTVFMRDGRLAERPVENLLAEMERHGVRVQRDPLAVSGKLAPGVYSVPSDVTSQYLSGLMMALAFTGGKSRLIPSTRTASAGYVELTLSVMRDFGISVVHDPDGSFTVDGSGYAPPREYFCEGDWSSAAFMLAAGAISGSCAVRGLRADSLQPDREILNVLEAMGAQLSMTPGEIKVNRKSLRGIRTDCDGTPDLVPVIAALAANASSGSVMTGVGRLRYKESDRLKALCEGLSSMGCGVEISEDEIRITPLESREFTADSFGDHRIAMAMAVASLGCGCVIRDAQAVDKSYPDFYKDLERLGVRLG
ncbi:MAG: 3-phosphoshikimate 1-carboxyvinyltransferase [Eubacteriaceae bacterium]|nr:3-phosphoshikimate 1-carboxyvinyltransferase [Eubacteriaceae bacterium]